jgi:hypothetical protein
MKHFFFLILLLCSVFACGGGSSDNNANNWTNQRARKLYKQTALRICDTYHPDYLALAIEVNTYYQHDPDDFDRFVDLYKDIYDTIKANPGYANTKVFVTFQLEKMKGLGTAVGYPGTPQWSILDKFDGKLDLVVFTTYPEVEYATPADIPVGYYSGIYVDLPANLSTKKLAFSEMGWNSEDLILVTGSNNTEASQVAFTQKFAIDVSALDTSGDIEFATWAFMHDYRNTGTYDPFRTIGLLTSVGVQKTAYLTWKNYKGTVNMKIGIGPVPANFPGSTAADWLAMYQTVPDLADLILEQTDWRDSPETAGEIPALFADMHYAKTYHQAEGIYGINFFRLDNGEAIIGN